MGRCPICNKDYDGECMHDSADYIDVILKLKAESPSNQMKLFRMDYSNDNAHFNDEIGIIKRRLDNIEKISREILKRVSL